MAVEDLWLKKDGTRSKRHGRGLRYRVTVKGYPATSCRTKGEADDLNARRIVAGPPKQGANLYVADLIEVWLAGKKHLAPKTQEICRIAASYCRQRWAGVKVGDVEPAQVQVWISSLESQRGPASTALRHKVLQCMKGSLRGHVDLSSVKAGREVVRDPRYLTAAELQKLAKACPGYEAMVLLLGTTGLRIGECRALTVGDVDVKRRRLRVRKSKTGAGRDVPVGPTVLAMLDLGRPASEPLFVGPQGGPIDVHNFRARQWKDACEAAKQPGLHIHDLRHTAASLAIASGADVKSVQRMLGHASATMTLDRYAGLFDTALDAVGDAMDALVFRP